MKAKRNVLIIVLLANFCRPVESTIVRNGFHPTNQSKIPCLENTERRVFPGNRAWHRWGYRPFRGYRWPAVYRSKASYLRGYYGRPWRHSMNWSGWGGYRNPWYYRGYYYPQWYYGYYPWYYWYY